MSKINPLLLVISLFVLAVSCNKNEVPQPTSGTYRGAFYQIYDEDTIITGGLSLGLSEGQKTFFVQVDSFSNYPISSNGYYSVRSNTEIFFMRGKNMQVPEPDRFMILDTSYSYVVTDTTFYFDLITEDDIQYAYRLDRF